MGDWARYESSGAGFRSQYKKNCVLCNEIRNQRHLRVRSLTPSLGKNITIYYTFLHLFQLTLMWYGHICPHCRRTRALTNDKWVRCKLDWWWPKGGRVHLFLISLFLSPPITAACPNPSSLKRGEGADDVKPPSGQTMMANREMVVNIYDANKVVKSFSTLCSPHNIFSMLPWVGQTLIKFARSRLLSKSVTSMINHNQRWWQGSGWGRRGQWINRGGGDG